MHATIIGKEGGMGQWMTKHLERLGYTVTGFDERRGDKPSILDEAALVVVSVPVLVTAETIRKTVKHMKQGACLMEIASLKTGIHETMREASESGVDVLCVHPMWGPSTETLEGKAVALIPIQDIEHEKEEALRLFPGASIEVVEAEEHDRLMSIILSLPYLINLAFAAITKDEDLTLLRKLSGSTYALQHILALSVSMEKPSLIEGLLSQNQNIENITKKYINSIKNVSSAVKNKKFNALHSEITGMLMNDPLMHEAQRHRQIAFEMITNPPKK
jgi:prephenate dehydrogenase